jgi:hypothetical protein
MRPSRPSISFFTTTLLLACIAVSAQVENENPELESVVVRGPLLEVMRAVPGEPYSAEQESEHSQTLANGTHIQQKRILSRTFRDSQGRIRTERMPFAGLSTPVEAEGQIPTVIHLYDPVAGYSYTLDSKRHIAHRIAVGLNGAANTNVNRGTAMTPRTGDGPARLPLWSRVPEMGRVKEESLGTQVIEGVQAEGTRTRMTTPAGAQGNDRPLVHVCDRWHSQELALTLVSDCTDPRSGRVILRLQNLDRGEPDPALFEVPADYTIVDEK